MKLYVIGIGPGGAEEMTLRAAGAIEGCQVVAGYQLYIQLIRELTEGKEIISTGMTKEIDRCRAAVDAARAGKTTAVVSSGDAGVYGMAGLVCQLAEPYPEIEIEVIPGITAACSSSAVLGAPLTHDFATVSLSDLLTDWALIERRLRAAAEADFVIALYNPASHSRKDHLRRACGIISQHRPATTCCGVVRNAGRADQHSWTGTLEELADARVDMLSTVIVGNSQTKLIYGRMVTPRGYAL